MAKVKPVMERWEALSGRVAGGSILLPKEGSLRCRGHP